MASRRGRLVVTAAIMAGATGAVGALVNMTMRDFHVGGTQVGMVAQANIQPATTCTMCHANVGDANTAPGDAWAGSKMAHAGRNPLFFAQMALANQDVSNVGYFCLRCHVPNSIVSGHAMQPDGSTLNSYDAEGVSCNFCHSMVDPIYRPGISPVEDEAILAALGENVPQFYSNAQFVLDPTGTRRGPRHDADVMHPVIQSAFHKSSNMCGTCHEVGNVAVTRQVNGTYRYNAIDEVSPVQNPHAQFPLERTFSEWGLSAFAQGAGVDMGGRFGGVGAGVVSTCQDCHMPKTVGAACIFTEPREDLRQHDFAGAGAQTLDIIAAFTADDPEINHEAIARGRTKAVEMLKKAATLEAAQEGSVLAVRVINEGGHKLPTGHIEGRRVWTHVSFVDAGGAIVGEIGHYDEATAELDEVGTRIYEMHVGLSADAAAATGLPAGATTKMALADTIVKDTRIPPRGFNNAAYEAAGAPAVGAVYADGQYWDDAEYAIPAGAVGAMVELFYQQTPKHYIEVLRDGNTSNAWGQILHDLWEQTGKGAPVLMASAQVELAPVCIADVSGDGLVDWADVVAFLAEFERGEDAADLDHDGGITGGDLGAFFGAYEGGC